MKARFSFWENFRVFVSQISHAVAYIFCKVKYNYILCNMIIITEVLLPLRENMFTMSKLSTSNQFPVDFGMKG